MSLPRLLGPLAAAACVAALGCGRTATTEASITVRGKLVEGGKPLTFDASRQKLPPGVGAPPAVQPAGPATLQFIPADGGDVTYGKVTEGGTFTADLPRAGRYKLVLTAGVLPPGAGDPFGGRFTAGKSQLVRDLKDGDDLTIDVTKPQG